MNSIAEKDFDGIPWDAKEPEQIIDRASFGKIHKTYRPFFFFGQIILQRSVESNFNLHTGNDFLETSATEKGIGVKISRPAADPGCESSGRFPNPDSAVDPPNDWGQK